MLSSWTSRKDGTPLTEKQLTDRIIKALKDEGSFAVKIHGGTFQSRGLPDIVCCYNSWFLGVEVKLPGKENTVSDLQRKKLWDIYNAGGIAVMVTSVAQMLEFTQVVRNGHRRKPNVEPPEGT